MKYVSIDIETTGLDRENCQILSIGAIIEDTNNPLSFEGSPKFHVAIKRPSITGDLYAINLNKDLIEAIVQYQTAQDQDEKNDLVQMTGMWFMNEDEVVQEFYQWLIANGMDHKQMLDGPFTNHPLYGKVPTLCSKTEKIHITVAGKNFATFDKIFLERLPRWKQAIAIRQRIIDPGILFTDWKNDESLPGLSECKKRAGLNEVVTHNAVEDAWDVIELCRKCY